MFNMKTKVVLLSLCGVLSLGFGVGLSLKQESNYLEADAAAHAANFDPYYYSGNYYDGITQTGEGMDGTLRKALTSHIFPKGWYTYGSTGDDHLSTVLQSADEDPTNSNNMIYLYTRDSVAKNAAKTWNREHCWPQANSNGCWGTGKAGADLLHIRPTYNETNNRRGNLKYGEAPESKKVTYNGMDYGYKDTYFMPLDSVKGDVARIIMYVWTAYKSHYSNLPDITSTFSDYDTLIKWHISDIPDVMEGRRNDYSETSRQENRNPFVDHPEYAWKIFGSKCSQSVLEEAKAKYPDEAPVTPTISLSETSKDIKKDESFKIVATTSDSTKVTWTSNNDNISFSGSTSSGEENLITGMKAGTSVLTATSASGVSKSCSVTVIEDEPPVVTTVSLDKENVEVEVGEEFTLTATSSDGSKISWFRSSEIIYLSTSSTKSGDTITLKGLEPGEVDVTIMNTLKIKAVCKVTIKEKESEPTEIDHDEPTNSGGCSGSIVTTSAIVSLLALAGIILILIRKKFVK